MRAKKKQASRMGPTESRIASRRFYGDEPEYSDYGELTNAQISRSFNWYNYMVDLEEAREFLVSYLIDEERLDDAARAKGIPDTHFPFVAAWIARLASKGYDIPANVMDGFERKFSEAAIRTNGVLLSITGDREDALSSDEKKRERINNGIADIDTLIDEQGSELDILSYLRKMNFTKIIGEPISDHYSKLFDDYTKLVEGDDLDIAEQYNVPYEVAEEKVVIFGKIVDAFEELFSIKRKTRKPRAKKIPDADSKFKFFKHKEYDERFKIKSFDVKEILGAHEVWSYNTRYDILTVLYAKDSKGFDIERMTILNVDEKKSTMKRIGKKADVIVPKVMTTERGKLKGLFDLCNNSFGPANDRTHENIVFMRIFRGM